ncbi:Gfo/Idh/MocA family oxidoreductase [Paenibacillus alkaliterrae]|uniref:Gfo/Idh/MocA family protein n=1 Tax=Paenibacillus alkaliterrae TaxID=320909 RepID=UPI001F1F5097|nr:Gfo/Idh/MocA family oxidoreductase [Paenibacillus alkaliterrae]MCF2940476.1 Gfo/Idh/MocA family oxidoreductase [Paenibacillus alkaliterrae]
MRQLLELDEVEIISIADTNPASRDSFVSKFELQDVKQFDDYKEMLAQADMDAAVICSPHTLHFQQALDVLESGCHVLIEKPMTCSSEEAEQLIIAAEQAEKLLQVSYQRHFLPEFLYIRQAITDGLIGKLTSINATLYQEWKQGTVGTWRQMPGLSGGGMLMDSGSHIVDMLLWTTGMTPVEVKPQLHQQGAPVEIDTFTSIRFAEGAIAGLNIIGFAPCWHETFVFCGEDGAIFYDNGKITLRRLGEKPIIPKLPEQTTNQDKSFVDAILGRHEVMVPGIFAKKVVSLTEMIYQSAGYKPY